MGDFSGAFVGLLSDRNSEVFAVVLMAAAEGCPEDDVGEYGNGEIP